MEQEKANEKLAKELATENASRIHAIQSGLVKDEGRGNGMQQKNRKKMLYGHVKKLHDQSGILSTFERAKFSRPDILRDYRNKLMVDKQDSEPLDRAQRSREKESKMTSQQYGLYEVAKQSSMLAKPRMIFEGVGY